MIIMRPHISVTDTIKILADETRVRILHLLLSTELAVGEITDALEMNQSAVSNQLGLLKKSGFSETRREGTRIYYRLPDPLLKGDEGTLIKQVFELGEKEGLFDYEKETLEKILELRKQSSLNYFEANPQNRCDPGESWEATTEGLFELVKGKKAVDLGCGDGELAAGLASSGNRVIGIDISPGRIAEAEKKHGGKRLSLEFRLADMEKTGLETGSMDLAVISQSLHHTARPGVVLNEASRILARGGMLLIWDLSAHSEEDFTEKYGDFWLGFAPEDIRKWIKEAGLESCRVKSIKTDSRYKDIETLIVSAVKP